MAQRKHPAATRDARLARLVRWLLLALGGAIAGMMLGELVAGSRLDPRGDSQGSVVREGAGFAGLSANPDALAADATAAPACRDCADSYGAAARLRARRAERAAADLHEPDAGNPDAAALEPTDDYRFGGRYPDPEPAPPLPAAREDMPPGDEMPPDQGP